MQLTWDFSIKRGKRYFRKFGEAVKTFARPCTRSEMRIGITGQQSELNQANTFFLYGGRVIRLFNKNDWKIAGRDLTMRTEKFSMIKNRIISVINSKTINAFSFHKSNQA